MADRCYRVNSDFLSKRAKGWNWKCVPRGIYWDFVGTKESQTVVVFQRITRTSCCDFDAVWLVKADSTEESLELWLAKQNNLTA